MFNHRIFDKNNCDPHESHACYVSDEYDVTDLKNLVLLCKEILVKLEQFDNCQSEYHGTMVTAK